MAQFDPSLIANRTSNMLNSFMQAKKTAATQRLVMPAMSGDASALNQLMMANPEVGMQVFQNKQQQSLQQKQQEFQQQQIDLTKQNYESEAAARAATAKKGDVMTNLEAAKAGFKIDDQGNVIPMTGADMPFQGGGLDAQAMNYVQQAEKDPALKNTTHYKLARSWLETPQTIQTDHGPITRPRIDISSALGKGGGAPPSGPSVVPGGERRTEDQGKYDEEMSKYENAIKALNAYNDIYKAAGGKPDLFKNKTSGEGAKLDNAHQAARQALTDILGISNKPTAEQAKMLDEYLPDPSGLAQGAGGLIGQNTPLSGMQRTAQLIKDRANTVDNQFKNVPGLKKYGLPKSFSDDAVINHPKLGSVSEDDIQNAMKKYKLSREEILKKLEGG